MWVGINRSPDFTGVSVAVGRRGVPTNSLVSYRESGGVWRRVGGYAGVTHDTTGVDVRRQARSLSAVGILTLVKPCEHSDKYRTMPKLTQSC